MSNGNAVQVKDLIQINSASSDALFPISSNGHLRSISIKNLLSNNQVDVSVGSNNNLIVSKNSTPTSSNTVAAGKSLWWDNDYLYVVTANNVIKRVSLSTF